MMGIGHLSGQLLHKKLGRYEEAEKAFIQAIGIKLKYDWAWAHLGQLLHEETGRLKKLKKLPSGYKN